MCVDYCGSPSIQYDGFLDSLECKITDEHHIEGQEIGVSSYFALSTACYSSFG